MLRKGWSTFHIEKGRKPLQEGGGLGIGPRVARGLQERKPKKGVGGGGGGGKDPEGGGSGGMWKKSLEQRKELLSARGGGKVR